MAKEWTKDDVLKLASAYQGAAVLHAAADLDLFTRMSGEPFSADEAAAALDADPRGLRTLLDALVALGFLDKGDEGYHVPPGVVNTLSSKEPGNVLAMVRHQGSCLRRWAQLAKVVKTGRAAERVPSIRGADSDYAAFIEAMDNISGPLAGQVVASVPVGPFRHLLDVGGGSGSWTIAFLRANPSARATIFDLPQVMPQARDRMAAAGLADRVSLVAGDFCADALPRGADLAWVSAIVHQNSRADNRALFAKVFAALEPGGRILIRDFVMEESRTAPAAGAMFAINMLVGPHVGGTFTFRELREDLQSAGFRDVQVLRRDDTMHSIIAASKPG